VTVLKVEKARVIQVIEEEKRGYKAVQLGYGKVKNSKLTKAMKGVFAKKNTEAKKKLKEFRVNDTSVYKEGNEFGLEIFKDIKFVDTRSKTIGKGFAGAMKRHNFGGMQASHGVSISHRSHGSTGNSQDPGKVWKGKKMAGQYGNVNKTIQNLTILEINNVDDLLYIKGSVPGPKNGYLTVRDAIKSTLPEGALKPAGLKDNIKPETNTSDQKEIVQDAEASIKTVNVEVKDNQPNDQKVIEQAITSNDESSDAEIKDADKNTNNKEG
jgi:large subunit ribosomal protein L3